MADRVGLWVAAQGIGIFNWWDWVGWAILRAYQEKGLGGADMKYYIFTILVMFEGEEVNRMFENIVATCAQDAANDVAHTYGTPCKLMSNIKQKEA